MPKCPKRQIYTLLQLLDLIPILGEKPLAGSLAVLVLCCAQLQDKENSPPIILPGRKIICIFLNNICIYIYMGVHAFRPPL